MNKRIKSSLPTLLNDQFNNQSTEEEERVKLIAARTLMRLGGIRVRRDNWVSVRYAEELNSGKSSVTPQRTDRHGILGEKLTDLQVSL